MGIAAVLDKAVAVIAPEAALKRTAARKKIEILNSHESVGICLVDVLK